MKSKEITQHVEHPDFNGALKWVVITNDILALMARNDVQQLEWPDRDGEGVMIAVRMEGDEWLMRKRFHLIVFEERGKAPSNSRDMGVVTTKDMLKTFNSTKVPEVLLRGVLYDSFF